jgi:hypothetical protein
MGLEGRKETTGEGRIVLSLPLREVHGTATEYRYSNFECTRHNSPTIFIKELQEESRIMGTVFGKFYSYVCSRVSVNANSRTFFMKNSTS